VTTITQDISDIAGVDDNTSWTFYTPELRESGDGSGDIISTKKVRKYPVAGVLTVELDPGPAVVIAADGKHYPFTVPEEDSELWPLIQAAVTIPPSTQHQQLIEAVDAWLEVNANAWDTIPGKPDVVAAGSTEAEARDEIGAQAVLPVGYYTPVGKPDGAVTALDSGQTVYTFGGSIGAVDDEEIVHTPTGSPSATYYEMDAGARVWRMGCEVKWPSGALGAATLVLPITPWGPPGGHPSGASAAGSVAGIHLSVFGNGIWYNSRWNVGSQTIYADYTTHGRFPTIWDGEFHKVEVWIDPEKGEGRLFVDGWSSKVFSNVAIANDTGDWAVWEQFNTNGGAEVPCVLRNLWVDTQERRLDSHAVTREDIAEAVDAVSSDAYDLATVTTSGGTTTLTNDSATMQQFAGSASHTMVLPTTEVPAGRLFIVQNSSTGVITVNASGGGFVSALASGGTGYFISVAATPTTAGNWLALPLVTTTAVQTLTGKALVSPIMRGLATVTTTSASSLTPVITTANLYAYTALAANLTINAPSGTPADGHQLDFRFKDSGTARTLTWNAIFRAIGVTLPTTTVIGKTMYVRTRYNVADTKFDVLQVLQEA
jgi:hypothetical protein